MLKQAERLVYWVTIGALAVALLLTQKCSPDCPPQEVDIYPCPAVDTFTRIEKDSIPYPVYVPKPGPRDTQVVEVPGVIDTQAILADYHRVYSYSDTLHKPNDFTAYLKEKISQNRVIEREFNLQNHRSSETIVVTDTVQNTPEKRRKVFVGGHAGGSRDILTGAFDFGPDIMYQTKKDLQFGYAYDLLGKYHEIRVLTKVSLGDGGKD